jgi:polyhydroxyalkanoate synthesis regulator phasin
MSYTQSKIECRWCSKAIGDGSEVACRKCYEELEGKVGDLEEDIEALKEKLKEAEAKESPHAE